MELLGLILTQGLTPFMTLGDCFLSPEVSMSPICQVEGSTLSLESPGQLPDVLGGSQSRLAAPRPD